MHNVLLTMCVYQIYELQLCLRFCHKLPACYLLTCAFTRFKHICFSYVL